MGSCFPEYDTWLWMIWLFYFLWMLMEKFNTEACPAMDLGIFGTMAGKHWAKYLDLWGRTLFPQVQVWLLPKWSEEYFTHRQHFSLEYIIFFLNIEAPPLHSALSLSVIDMITARTLVFGHFSTLMLYIYWVS